MTAEPEWVLEVHYGTFFGRSLSFRKWEFMAYMQLVPDDSPATHNQYSIECPNAWEPCQLS